MHGSTSENEELHIFKEMLEHLDDIVFSHDVAGRFTYVSPAWKRLFKFSDAEMATLDFGKVIPEEYLPEALSRTERQIRGETVEQPWELEVYDHDRNRIWMQIRTQCVYDDDGNLLKVYGVARNIQEKKAIEAMLLDYTENLEKRVEARTRAMQESTAKYRILVENANDAIFVVRGDKIIFANPSTLAMLGYDAATLSRIPVSKLIHPEDREKMLDFYKDRIKNTGGRYLGYYTFRCIREDGEILWLQINAVRTKWEDRHATLSFGRDITREKQLELQLLQSQKMEAIGTLAGGIAHDFNNILSAIMGYTEMSLAEAAPDTQIPRRLEHVMAASRRAKALVSRILDFSRQSEVVRQPTAIGDVVTEALQLLRGSIPSTIRFVEAVDPQIGEVYGDATQIHQIVMNLCTNAAQAMQGTEGTLEVRLEKREISDADITLFADLDPGPYACLSISDTGPGMDRRTLQKIFDPYFTTKKKGEGTGLGLSVVHGIVKNMGGEVKVYSEVGKGAVFHVYLPCISSERQSAANDMERLPQGRETVLLVDDEEIIIDMISELLTGSGYTVIPRSSSMEALEAFRANPEKFDLLISDQSMPQLSGISLAAKIKAIRPDLPVILCTGFGNELASAQQDESAIDAFVNKPILMRELAQTVRRVLDQSGSGDTQK